LILAVWYFWFYWYHLYFTCCAISRTFWIFIFS